MLNRVSLFGVIITLFLSSVCYSEDITVVPGVGTLQNAIDSANEGDVLLLQDGVYSDSSQDRTVIVDKSLTIKAESKSANPQLQFRVSILKDKEIEFLTFQGLEIYPYFDHNAIFAVDTKLAKLTMLEVKRNAPIYISNASDYRAVSMAEVASVRTCKDKNRRGDHVIFEVLYVFGGDYCSGRNQYLSKNNSGTSYVVGNRFELIEAGFHLLTGISISSGASSLLAGNRFYYPLGLGGDDRDGGFPHFFNVNSEYALITNNLFKAVAENWPKDLSTYEVTMNDSKGDSQYDIRNNIFDLSGVKIRQPLTGDREQRPLLDNGNNNFRSFSGNMILGYDDKILPDNIELNIKNNLCYADASLTHAENCGSDNGNISVDPKFVDNTDYKLQNDSPAIDAGSENLMLADIDGSRNDMGIYGGSWNIEQFDRQRAADFNGPYLYPVIDTAATVAQGQVRVKFVSYARQQ